MKPDQFVGHSPRAVFRELADDVGGVLLHLDSGAYHGLNATGTLIWNLIGDGSTLGDLLSGLRSRIADAPADLEGDVEDFVQDLVERGLLTVAEE